MTLRRTPFTLGLLFAAAALHAQVTPPEPFGGRPFGSAPGTPSVQQQRQEQLQQQQQATMGAAAPTVVQVVPPQAAAPAPATVGPGAAMQASRTTGQVPGASPAPVQAMPAAPPSQPVQPPAAAPAPSTLSPPFAARNAPPAAGASAPTTTQLPVKGLPGDAPKLVITGSMFSPNPKNRFLIVNGQTFREGADLGQGVVLEEVHKESAVLGYKGAKYNVMF